MKKLFYCSISENTEKNYQDMIDDLRSLKDLRYYCYTKNFYNIFLQIIQSLVADKEIVLLDYDFTEEEIISLLGENTDLEKKVNFESDISSIDELNYKISLNKDWKITLFTSGTTGRPKKIVHNFSSLTRFIKAGEKFKSDTWGFAYNPTHMAGLQVFFQALINNNPLIRLFDRPKSEITDLIKKFNISHVSATPTFYRLLLPVEEQLVSVKKLTMGGEKFDTALAGKLKRAFPNALFTNVYASTEAGTVLASEGDIFRVRDDFKNLVKIENEELFLHNSLTGQMKSNNEWYATGDLVEITEQKPLSFKFRSRKNEMINVGGYKVNPYEIEDIIRNIDGVTDVLIKGKTHTLIGNILCADIVVQKGKNIFEKDIRLHLKDKLQSFKIPRIITFVDDLKKSRSGKVKRP